MPLPHIDFSHSFTAELKSKFSGDYSIEIVWSSWYESTNILSDDIFQFSLLFFCLDKGYNVPKIARLLNLAPWRIKYVMRKAGLKSRQFSEISNLECVVSEIVRMFPNSGIFWKLLLNSLELKYLIHFQVSKILLANLKVAARLGLKVSLDRLRESFCRVKVIRSDPPRRTIKRRVYSVPGPLSLWHVDSHHKLSR